jgi:hypothetical protein
MVYLTYILLAPLSLLVTLLALILSPILPLFAKYEFGWCDNHSYEAVEPRLPNWLNWFMTPDNSLFGDSTFKQINGIGYLARVKWLIRNPAYSFALRYLTAPYTTAVYGDNLIKDNSNAKAGWCLVKANGLFQFTYIKRIFSSSCCVYVVLGWNIRHLVDDSVAIKNNPHMATFAFSPRLSGFR